MNITQKYLLLTAIVGAALSLGLGAALVISYHHADELEEQIQALRAQFAEQDRQRTEVIQMAGPGVATSPVDQQIKDLSTRFVGDNRSIAEKLRDFLAEHQHEKDLAVASKVIADMAENQDALTNEELNWLFQQPVKPVIKRVAAQVLSARGDNQALDHYIAQYQPGLVSGNPAERRAALGELGKTRYAGAATMIVPLLEDEDTTVLLDALLALRLTGNESHISTLKSLARHPDSSVSWLATDALNHLELLSKKARTRVSVTDIVAELPPVTFH